MWERVEKANEYRVGIIPRDTVLGTGKYNATDLEAELTGLDPATEYKSKFEKSLFDFVQSYSYYIY